MARFTGTNGPDLILRNLVSEPVVSDPPDILVPLEEANNIEGRGGDDFLAAGDAGDDIFGGSGRDSIVGGDGADRLWGNDGDGGPDGGDHVSGGAGADQLFGGAGRDRLFGGEGQDYLTGGSGADRMRGGPGRDVFRVNSADDRVFERPDEGFDTIVTWLTSFVLPTHVEALDFDQTADSVRGVGNRLDNELTGGEGSDRLLGLAGDDTLDGGAAGSDRLFGGAGEDWLVAGAGGDADHLTGGTGDDYLEVGADASAAHRLVGGKGGDVFLFNSASGSAPGRSVTIAAGGGAAAFERAGPADGDWIDLSAMDADAGDPDVLQPLVFGGEGKGRLLLADTAAGHTLVRADVDDDRAFEFRLVIEDGAVRASAYTAEDFLLDWG